MGHLQSEITIQRPKADVWAALSDLTATAQYMPGIEALRLTSEETHGVGAARHCTFKDGIELYERVIRWEEGEGYTLETTRAVKVPMKANEITFALHENGQGTVVTQSMRYQMKGGLLAPLMERMARGMMRKALDGALAGLKTYVEAVRRDGTQKDLSA